MRGVGGDVRRYCLIFRVAGGSCLCRLKQWPHKQPQHRSACLLILTHEQNEVLHVSIESSIDKHIAQY